MAGSQKTNPDLGREPFPVPACRSEGGKVPGLVGRRSAYSTVSSTPRRENIAGGGASPAAAGSW